MMHYGMVIKAQSQQIKHSTVTHVSLLSHWANFPISRPQDSHDSSLSVAYLRLSQGNQQHLSLSGLAGPQEHD